MPLLPRSCAHPSQCALPGQDRLRHYTLRDAHGDYAAAAIAEHPDCLELHLEVLRYGPRAARALTRDLEELKALARRLGKGRIVGLAQLSGQEADARWFKFTRRFGFTGQRLYQCAELAVD